MFLDAKRMSERRSRERCNERSTFVPRAIYKFKMWSFHVVVLWNTAKKCTEMRAARAARLLFLFQRITFLLFGVVIAVALISIS